MSRNYYYSYCCGKVVERNKDCIDEVLRGEFPEKGYHCSRCKNPVTVYGNPATDKDRKALKEYRDNARKQSGVVGKPKYSVNQNGDLIFSDRMGNVIKYKKADLYDVGKNSSYNWLVFDLYCNFVAYIELSKCSKSMENPMDTLNELMYKCDLAACRTCSALQFDDIIGKHPNGSYKLSNLRDTKNIKNILTRLGWEFRKDGRIK